MCVLLITIIPDSNAIQFTLTPDHHHTEKTSKVVRYQLYVRYRHSLCRLLTLRYKLYKVYQKTSIIIMLQRKTYKMWTMCVLCAQTTMYKVHQMRKRDITMIFTLLLHMHKVWISVKKSLPYICVSVLCIGMLLTVSTTYIINKKITIIYRKSLLA